MTSTTHSLSLEIRDGDDPRWCVSLGASGGVPAWGVARIPGAAP